MLAWVIVRGYYIWPGIFLGAFIGNVWAYIDLSSISNILLSVFSGSINGLGDVICSVGAAYLINKKMGDGDPFKNLPAFICLCLFGVALGPLLSATLGVSALWASGFLAAESYLLSLFTWFLGDAVGVLLFTPLVLVYFFPHPDAKNNINKVEFVLFTAILISAPFINSFPKNLIPLHQLQSMLLVPLLLWGAFRMNQVILFNATSYLLFGSIAANYFGVGLFNSDTQLESILSLQLFIFVTVSSIFILNSLINDKNTALKKLQLAVDHDPLTKIYNRQYFDKRLTEEINLQARFSSPFCIAMYDIDRFKAVNDTYGHLFGDEILIRLSEIAAKQKRDIDVLARWGGEEFVILMPHTPIEGAKIIAERIRATVEQTALLPEGVLTISFGLYEVAAGDEPLGIMIQVDEALYHAKNNGRNQVQCAQSGQEYKLC